MGTTRRSGKGSGAPGSRCTSQAIAEAMVFTAAAEQTNAIPPQQEQVKEKDFVLSHGREELKGQDAVLSHGKEKLQEKDAVLSHGKEKLQEKDVVLSHGKEKLQEKDVVLSRGKEDLQEKGVVLSHGKEDFKEKDSLLSHGKEELQVKDVVLSHVKKVTEARGPIIPAVNDAQGHLVSMGFSVEVEKGLVEKRRRAFSFSVPVVSDVATNSAAKGETGLPPKKSEKSIPAVNKQLGSSVSAGAHVEDMTGIPTSENIIPAMKDAHQQNLIPAVNNAQGHSVSVGASEEVKQGFVENEGGIPEGLRAQLREIGPTLRAELLSVSAAVQILTPDQYDELYDSLCSEYNSSRRNRSINIVNKNNANNNANNNTIKNAINNANTSKGMGSGIRVETHCNNMSLDTFVAGSRSLLARVVAVRSGTVEQQEDEQTPLIASHPVDEMWEVIDDEAPVEWDVVDDWVLPSLWRRPNWADLVDDSEQTLESEVEGNYTNKAMVVCKQTPENHAMNVHLPVACTKGGPDKKYLGKGAALPVRIPRRRRGRPPRRAG